MGKKSGSRSGMNNPDHSSERLETIFWVKILKYFVADEESGIGDGNIRIRDKNPGSATLLEYIQIAVLWNRDHNFLS
jgi:hypothetical protein